MILWHSLEASRVYGSHRHITLQAFPHNIDIQYTLLHFRSNQNDLNNPHILVASIPDSVTKNRVLVTVSFVAVVIQEVPPMSHHVEVLGLTTGVPVLVGRVGVTGFWAVLK